MTFQRQIGIGFFFLLSAALANLLYHAFFPPALPWTVLPLFFYTFGMSIIAPGATLLALDLFPHIRGTVASCQSFAVTLLGGILLIAASAFGALPVALGVVADHRPGGVCTVSIRIMVDVPAIPAHALASNAALTATNVANMRLKKESIIPS